MANAQAVLVGLKAVNPSCYGGWDGQNGCWGCELDVDNMHRLLQPLGYQVHTLKTHQATAGTILQALRGAAQTLGAGDTLLFYFSGHGGQQPDRDGDEADGRDETLVAYDREVIDDELNEIWPTIRQGVRIVMLSDSCNSGTNYKMVRDVRNLSPVRPIDEQTGRRMAQMIHIGGCRDGWTSDGYRSGGAFTMALCNAWDGGDFQGSYPEFHKRICSLIQSAQKPQYNEYGPVSDAFRNQKPFTPGQTDRSIVRCTLEVPAANLEEARKIIQDDAVACLLDALKEAAAGRPGSVSGSCTVPTSGGGGGSCTGTITYHF